MASACLFLSLRIHSNWIASNSSARLIISANTLESFPLAAVQGLFPSGLAGLSFLASGPAKALYPCPLPPSSQCVPLSGHALSQPHTIHVISVVLSETSRKFSFAQKYSHCYV
ncbi:Uncharacterized protein Rs2_26959 [Raphanus sativus]|nr:Uncharacterized protein Rs2_26959 [Raphanus sativus]